MTIILEVKANTTNTARMTIEQDIAMSTIQCESPPIVGKKKVVIILNVESKKSIKSVWAFKSVWFGTGRDPDRTNDLDIIALKKGDCLHSYKINK